MTIAVVAEKPSVANSIADVLGAGQKGPGLRRGNGYVVTWALGHLVGLAEPHEMDAGWKAWRFDRLPMLPPDWILKVYDKTRDHFQVVAGLINAPDVERVVCATDAGREGELIFRYIYRKAGCDKPVERLWISSLTPDAIRAGFQKLRPGASFDPLAAAAEARSRADWLVGMNFSRAYTLRFGGGDSLFSVGRVQTPTLAMLVERELAIRTFTPEKYCEVEATFGSDADAYTATWFDPAGPRSEGDDHGGRLPADGELAETIRARCEGQPGRVIECAGTDRSNLPPLLYDLTELQRHANRLYGLTAQATLAAAQSLYEHHKLLSYPRTDSRHLSASVAAQIGPVVGAFAFAYQDRLAPSTGQAPLSKRFVDDSKVTDHHAIIPTDTSPRGKRLTPDEAHVYDLVCRRLLMAWHDEHRTRVTRAVTRVDSGPNGETTDLFRASGTVITQAGWKVLDIEPRKQARKDKDEGDERERRLPDGLSTGQVRSTTAVKVKAKQTSAPKRFTDATILTAMESAGRTLDSRELEEAMRERGLGTPATRAAILETLLARKYIERKGKSLHATDKGIALIQVVEPSVKSPQLTGEWELALKRLERGQGTLPELMTGIEKFVVDVVGRLRTMRGVERRRPPSPGPAVGRRDAGPGQGARPGTTAGVRGKAGPGGAEAAGRDDSPGRSGAARSRAQTPAGAAASEAGTPAGPKKRAPSARKLLGILRERFGLRDFREPQAEICKAIAGGADALVVMPHGGGKSLAVHVAGLARGGTALVVCPDAAAVEAQRAQLGAWGLRIESIHAGRGRDEARAACRGYLDGTLEALVITAERLSVAGFPEMLARRRPAVVVVDEAHAASRRSQDPRADYLGLAGALAGLRSAPLVALTGPATARVQADIQAELGLAKAKRFVAGCCRDHVSLEVVAAPAGDLVGRAVANITSASQRPAIVFVPTRRLADELLAALGARRVAAAPFHAGLDEVARAHTGAEFARGALDVVIASSGLVPSLAREDIRTVVHLGRPVSVARYVEQIGLAGRDGAPARALLFTSAGTMPAPAGTAGTGAVGGTEAVRGTGTRAVAGTGAVRGTAGTAVVTAAPPGAVPGDEVAAAWRAELDELFGPGGPGDCRLVRLRRCLGETGEAMPCGRCDLCRTRA